MSRSFDHTINANDRVPKNFTSIFNVNACVLLGMILRCVILYFVARTSLYSCTVCVSGLWQNEVKCCFLGLQPLSFSFNFYFIFHFKLSCAKISWGLSKCLLKLHSMTSMILKTSTETYRNTGWALLLMKILINITWFTLCQGSQLNHIMQLRAI